MQGKHLGCVRLTPSLLPGVRPFRGLAVCYCPLSSKTQTEGGYTLHLSRLGLHLPLTLSLSARSLFDRLKAGRVSMRFPGNPHDHVSPSGISRVKSDTKYGHCFPLRSSRSKQEPSPTEWDGCTSHLPSGSQTTNRRINTEKTMNCDKCY